MLKLLKRARQPSGRRAAVRSRAFIFHRHACLPLSLMAPAFALAAPAATATAPESAPDNRDADAIQLAEPTGAFSTRSEPSRHDRHGHSRSVAILGRGHARGRAEVRAEHGGAQ